MINERFVRSLALPAFFALVLAACSGAPTATATASPQVAVGAVVRLDGSGSSSPDGGPLSFAWALTTRPDGSEARLANAQFAVATLAPDLAGEYQLSLTVTNASGQSAETSVTVAARPGPTAEAGASQKVAVGTAVTLDGSGSTAPGGGALTYQWTLADRPANSSAALDDAGAATPTFTADLAGTYRATLVVTEAGVSSAADTVYVVAGASVQAPIAEAGADLQAVTGQTEVVLDGRTSMDPGGAALSGSWTITAAPAGSVFAQKAFAGLVAAFTPDVDGDYEATLAVFNGHAEASDTLTLHAEGPCCLTSTLSPMQQVQVATPAPFAVEVKSAAGLPVRDVDVGFELVSGDATLAVTAAKTGADGVAMVPVEIGTTLGEVAVRATCAACGTAGTVDQLLEVVGGPAVRFETTIGPDAQVPGPIVVGVQGLDAYGNLASSNDALTITVTGSATFAATATAGTVVSGGGTAQAEVTLDAGQFEIDLNDATAESVTVVVSNASGLPADLFTVAQPTQAFPAGNGASLSFTFPSAPIASADGEVLITAQGDFGDTFEYLTVFVGEAPGTAVGQWGPYDERQDCAPPETHAVTVPAADLVADTSDGTVTIRLETSGDVDLGVCPMLEASVELSYPSSRTATFLP